MAAIAALTALGLTAIGTPVAPTRLTSAGTIEGETHVAVRASPMPARQALLAPLVTVPDAAAALPGGAPSIAGLAGYRWPLAHARITLPFGPSPWGEWIVRGQSVHDGVDLATFCGDKIVAAHDGTVLAAGRHFDNTLGWIGDLRAYYARLDAKKLWTTLPIVVVIDDGNGYRSIYAHFGKITVRTGETVKAGELLGYEGRTGHASGCHLHYGLFSAFETASFAIDPAIMARMKLPSAEIARINPLLVLPPRPTPTPKPTP
jgi:murein DD-endopeptidase MepM/ murein hydrolase activator NlpD